jgi:hypothetical protein
MMKTLSPSSWAAGTLPRAELNLKAAFRLHSTPLTCASPQVQAGSKSQRPVN